MRWQAAPPVRETADLGQVLLNEATSANNHCSDFSQGDFGELAVFGFVAGISPSCDVLVLGLRNNLNLFRWLVQRAL